MTSIHIRQLSKAIDDKSTGAIIECDGKKQKVLFNRVKVGYGEKVFFTCPICGKNKERLYLEGRLFRCSDCCSVNPYKGIQNTTKGGYDYIAYTELQELKVIGFRTKQEWIQCKLQRKRVLM